MSLFSILSYSANGLAAHRARAHTAGHNLANVSTPGYSRQRVNLSAREGGVVNPVLLGGGVQATSVSRVRDQFLEAQVTSSFASAAHARAEQEVLSSVRVFDTDVPDRVDRTLGDFFASLRDVSVDPSDPGARQAVLSSAERLSASFRRAAGAINAARTGLDTRVSGLTQRADAMAQRLAELNRDIAKERGIGREPNDLLDERVRVTEELSHITGATAIADDDGNMNLFLNGQVPLVLANRAARLNPVADPSNGGLLAVELVGTDGSGPNVVGPPLIGGELGGLMSSRDGALLTAQNDLDQLAFDVSTAINAVHTAGFGLDGAGGRALLDVGGAVAGAAFNLQIDAAVAGNPDAIAASATAAGVPGDNNQMLALILLEDTALASGAPPAQAAVGLMTALGGAASSAAARADHEETLRDHLNELRDGVAAVSTEEEVTHLTEAQRAFEAMSKVLRTADNMLETVISLK